MARYALEEKSIDRTETLDAKHRRLDTLSRLLYPVMSNRKGVDSAICVAATIVSVAGEDILYVATNQTAGKKKKVLLNQKNFQAALYTRASILQKFLISSIDLTEKQLMELTITTAIELSKTENYGNKFNAPTTKLYHPIKKAAAYSTPKERAALYASYLDRTDEHKKKRDIIFDLLKLRHSFYNDEALTCLTSMGDDSSDQFCVLGAFKEKAATQIGERSYQLTTTAQAVYGVKTEVLPLLEPHATIHAEQVILNQILALAEQGRLSDNQTIYIGDTMLACETCHRDYDRINRQLIELGYNVTIQYAGTHRTRFTKVPACRTQVGLFQHNITVPPTPAELLRKISGDSLHDDTTDDCDDTPNTAFTGRMDDKSVASTDLDILRLDAYTPHSKLGLIGRPTTGDNTPSSFVSTPCSAPSLTIRTPSGHSPSFFPATPLLLKDREPDHVTSYAATNT